MTLATREMELLTEFVRVLSPAIARRLHFEQYENIIGIAESENFRRGLVVSLCLYRMNAEDQAAEIARERLARSRRLREAEKALQITHEDAGEITRLLDRPGGDREYLHSLLSTARMEAIFAKMKITEQRAARGRPQKHADLYLIKMMRQLYQDETGKKPGKAAAGPFARLLYAVHADFRKINREMDAELGEVTPLSADIVELAKKGKK